MSLKQWALHARGAKGDPTRPARLGILVAVIVDGGDVSQRAAWPIPKITTQGSGSASPDSAMTSHVLPWTLAC